MAINTSGNADKKPGVKPGHAEAPKKTDDYYGSRTNYADVSKTKIKGRKCGS